MNKTFSQYFIIFLAFCVIPLHAAEQLRNPTEPADQSSLTQEDDNSTVLSLQSIVRYGNQYWAVINGQLIKAGDHINLAEVISINANEVKIIDGNKILSLSLFDHSWQQNESVKR